MIYHSKLYQSPVFMRIWGFSFLQKSTVPFFMVHRILHFILAFSIIFYVHTVFSGTINRTVKGTVQAKQGMVVSSEPNASQAGIQILKRGGNSIDAAVAVGFALAVTHPQAGNIGGGGFMVIRMADGTATSFDYREKAPAKSARDMFLDHQGNYIPEKSQEGYAACGVPGSVAGMLLAHEKFGKLSRAQVLQPAINLAQKGFRVTASFARDINSALMNFGKYPATKKICLHAGSSYKEGDTFIQSDLAETLKRIAKEGRDGFYKGKTANLIVAEMNRGGGLISFEDLVSYGAVERTALRGNYHGSEILSMGPPSSGGVLLIHLLNLLENYDIAGSGFGSVETMSIMTEAMKLAYADRAEFLGDPDFYNVPVKTLLSRSYADERRKLIVPGAAKPSAAISHGVISPKEHEETTHYSVIDRWGNAVSTTTTINGWFGNGVVVDGAGFFLNNEMDDFSAKPGVPNMFGVVGAEANAVQPNKRMLSCMTPTIVVKNQKPFLVLGSPGGSTIITTVLQVLMNVVDHGMDLRRAVDAPRIHHQWLPDTLQYEKTALPHEVVLELKRRGFFPVERTGLQGRVEAIMVDVKDGSYLGVSDFRGPGLAVGY
jgi:gamma-glutamyltranspeptidase / glutathione hydrolase